MACLFGARLAPHAEVILLGTWAEGLAAIGRDGIRLEVDGRTETARVRAAGDPAECAGARQALVLVKSWQTARAAEQLAACLAPDGLAVTLQNGLGNLEILQAALGPERAALGVTTTGGTLLGPGHVRLGGLGPTFLAQHPGIEPIADLLRKAGFAVEAVEDLDGLVWGKLAVNAAINPLTALLRVPNGELLARPDARWVMRAAAEEVGSVAAARGLRLPDPDPAARAEQVAERTGCNRSSMLQDVERGAPTEIDAINGAVAREGERLGVPAPVNATLWRLVRALVAEKESS
jgi:2-dehydropantoate 2-reductase